TRRGRRTPACTRFCRTFGGTSSTTLACFNFSCRLGIMTSIAIYILDGNNGRRNACPMEQVLLVGPHQLSRFVSSSNTNASRLPLREMTIAVLERLGANSTRPAGPAREANSDGNYGAPARHLPRALQLGEHGRAVNRVLRQQYDECITSVDRAF